MLSRTYRFSLARPHRFGQKQVGNQIVLSVGLELTTVPKFAVVVPSKFCKKAVSRNRTKRLVWQGLSQLKEKIKPGVYKILVTGNFSELTLNQVMSKVEKVFEKGGYLNAR